MFDLLTNSEFLPAALGVGVSGVLLFAGHKLPISPAALQDLLIKMVYEYGEDPVVPTLRAVG